MSKWLIIGASGLLGHSLCRHLRDNNKRVVGLRHNHSVDVNGVEDIQIDLVNAPEKLETEIERVNPDVVVHAAGLTNVDLCESSEAVATILHADIASIAARASRQCSAKMVYISTDHLWDGSKPLVSENQEPHPLNAYARTKLDGERRTLDANPDSLVVRTNFYGPGRPWRPSFSDWIIGELSEGNQITAFVDSFYTPICLSRLCATIVELVERNANGVYSVVGAERLSKYDFAIRLACAMGLNETLINKGYLAKASLKAPRPLDMSLSSEKISAFLGRAMPNLDECFEDLKTQTGPKRKPLT